MWDRLWRVVGVMAALVPVQTSAQAVGAPLVLPDPDALPYPIDRASIVDYPAVVTCGGEPVTPIRAEPLRPSLIVATPIDLGHDRPEPPAVDLTFDIAADGRPYSIRIARAGSYPVVIGGTLEPQAQASLLGWRFQPRALTGCRLETHAVTTPLADASEALIARTLALTGPGTADGRRVLMRALARPDDDCRTTPGRRTVVSPGPDVQPDPGTRAWTVVRYDIDADGRIQLGETLESSPDPTVIQGVSEAYAQTTFQHGKPRRGCIMVLERYGPTAPPGPIPMPDWEPLNRCTAQQRARFTPGRLTYPPALRDRGVEGWALVRFDIASWGSVGGVTLLQAEPAQAFGDQALAIIRQGRATPAFDHAVGCVDRVVFRLGDDEERSDEN